MQVQQFVMAYHVEQDRLRAILPDGFRSLRPVLRINAELTDSTKAYAELNTAVEKDSIRGWLNIGFWDDISFAQNGKSTVFFNDILEISFTPVGIQGSCPVEKDNGGCFFGEVLRVPEVITVSKEFCDCRFIWKLPNGSSDESIGKTLPAYATPVTHAYPRQPFTVSNAAVIPCTQVLGTYCVNFQREHTAEENK